MSQYVNDQWLIFLYMIKTLALPLCLVVVTLACSYDKVSAQDFLQRKYATRVERDIVYGTATGFAGKLDTLRLNYWKPHADGNPRRPLIIFVHGGGFTGGSRTDFDVLCEGYAQRGYAAATISYRLGFHPPPLMANPYAYDTAEVVRAAYRASQDLFGAARFLVKRASLDSVSVSSMIIGGASAGGITVLQAAYISESERYGCTRAFADVPGIGVAGKRPDLGPTTGTLHADAATPRILAVVNLFGAIPDTSFIERADDPAMYQYHQTGDPVVSCVYAKGLWSYPFGIPDNYYFVHGSCNIKKRLDNLGYTSARHRSWIFNGSVHGFHGAAAVEIDIADFLAPLTRDALTSVDDDAFESERNDSSKDRTNNDLTSKDLTNKDRTNKDRTNTVMSDGATVVVMDLAGRLVFQGTDAHPSGAHFPSAHLTRMLNLPIGAYIMKIGVETRLFLVLR